MNSEAEALRDSLVLHCQTPYPVTGIPPGNMLFQDGTKFHFPRNYHQAS